MQNDENNATCCLPQFVSTSNRKILKLKDNKRTAYRASEENIFFFHLIHVN